MNKMKNIFFILLLLLSRQVIAQSNQGVVVATVGISNSTLIQEDRKISVSFDLFNKIGVQPQLRYMIRLVDLRSPNSVAYDQKIYDEKISLTENSKLSKTVLYEIPDFVTSGTYQIWIDVINENGFLLGLSMAGEVKVTDIKNIVQIDPNSCVFLTAGEPIQITREISIKDNELLEIKCLVKSTYAKNIIMSPVFETRLHSIFGSLSSTSVVEQKNYEIKKGNNDIIFEIPKAIESNDYYLNFKLISVDGTISTNNVSLNYVLNYFKGQIQNVVFDKTFYKAGEIANIKVFSTQTGKGTIVVVASGDQGILCSATATKDILNPYDLSIEIPIINDCFNPKAVISLETNGKTIDESIIQIVSVAETETDNSIWIISIFIIVLILFLFFLVYKKTKTFIIILIILLSFVGVVNAAPVKMLPPPSYTVNLNSSASTIYSGDSISLTGTVNKASNCSLNGLAGGTKWYAGVTTINENTGPLNQNTSFSFACTDGTSSGSKTLTVFVNPRPVPQGRLSVLSPVSYNNSSTLYWAFTGADSCSINKDDVSWTNLSPNGTGYSYLMNIPVESAWDTAIDNSNNVYIINNNNVLKYNSSGMYITGFGYLTTPVNIAVDPSGFVYVTQQWDGSFVKIDQSGNVIFQTGGLNGPSGIVYDPSGFIYVASSWGNQIIKYDSSGNLLLTIGSAGSENGQLNFPVGVAVDSSGNLFVSDAGNNRVQKFNSSGVYMSKFGTAGSANGQFNFPNGIAIDSSNNIFVLDKNNGRIQKFDQNGIFLDKFSSSVGSSWGGISVDLLGNVYNADGLYAGVNKYGNLSTGSVSTGSLQNNTNYILSCISPEGGIATTTPLALGVIPPVSVNISATPTSVVSGNTTNISMSQTGATNCTITKNGALFDQRSFTTYNQSTTTVNTPIVIPTAPPSGGGAGIGSGVILSPSYPPFPLSSGSISTTTTFIATCTDINNNSTSSSVVVGLAVPETLSISADPTIVPPGNTSLITWNSTGFPSCVVEKFLSSGKETFATSTSGSKSSGQLSGINTFQIVCGSQTKSVNTVVDPKILGEGLMAVSLTAASSTINYGSSTDISLVTTNANSCTTTKNSALWSTSTNINLIKEIGSRGVNDGQFIAPTYVAIDRSGNFYVVDITGYINKYDSDGNFLLKFGNSFGSGQLSHPVDVAIDSSNNVYVTNFGGYEVKKYDSNGNFISKFGSYGTGDGQFKYISTIAIDSSGNIYVSDEGTYKVQKFDSNGNFISKFGSYGTGDGQFLGFNAGMEVDSLGNIYVGDYLNGTIQKFNSSGNFISKFGSVGTGDNQFKYLRDFTFDSRGDFYTVESDQNIPKRNLMKKFSSTGQFLFNFLPRPYNFDYAELWGVDIDSNGNMYVVELNGYRVYKILVKSPSFTKNSDNLNATTTFVATCLGQCSANKYVYSYSGKYTVPQGVNSITVEVWGGGGGGASTYNGGGGGGGGGGGYGKQTVSVVPGTTYNITIGKGGSAGSAGGTTSFGSVINATGGQPGRWLVWNCGSNCTVAGGLGGTSNASTTVNGVNGAASSFSSSPGGRGGNGGGTSEITIIDPITNMKLDHIGGTGGNGGPVCWNGCHGSSGTGRGAGGGGGGSGMGWNNGGSGGDGMVYVFENNSLSCSIGASSTVVVNVKQTQPVPINLTLTADPLSVYSGSTTQIQWDGQGADSCTTTANSSFFSSGISGSKPSNPITTATTFTTSCVNVSTSSSKSIEVGILPPEPTGPILVSAGCSVSQLGNPPGDNNIYVNRSTRWTATLSTSTVPSTITTEWSGTNISGTITQVGNTLDKFYTTVGTKIINGNISGTFGTTPFTSTCTATTTVRLDTGSGGDI